MRMQIAHSGKTGKDTSITFDTDKNIFCYGREKYDVFIYAEQTRDVNGVVEDLKKIGYEEVDKEQFRERCGIKTHAGEEFFRMESDIALETMMAAKDMFKEVAGKYPDWAEEHHMTLKDIEGDCKIFPAIADKTRDYLDAAIHAHMKEEFILDMNVYSGRAEGSLFIDDDGMQHLNTHNLATEIIEDCIEEILADNNMMIPDEDREEGMEEEESWLYGTTFGDLQDVIEENAAKWLKGIAKEVREDPERDIEEIER